MTWMRKKSLVFALCLTAAALFGGNISVQAETEKINQPSAQAKLSAIESISTVGDGDTADLMIKLSAPATYTSYKTTAPLRLIIDLSQVTQGEIKAPVELNKANFKKVSVNRYDTDAGVLTRVEIELAKDVEAVLSASPEKPGELKVSFPTFSSKDVAADKPAELPVAKSEPPAVVPATPSPAGSAVVATSENSSKPITTARNLTGISVKENSILLSVAGGVGEFKSFRLNKPERYVVDLFEVKSLLPNRLVQINSSGVASARLGLYPDKVRVVFDALSNSFPDANVVKTADGIQVELAVKPINENPNTKLVTASADKNEAVVAKPVEVAPSIAAPVATQTAVKPSIVEPPVNTTIPPKTETVTAPVKQGGPVSVEMIDFQVINGVSRVSVKVAGEAKVDTPVTSPGFVTLNLKNTHLPKQLQRSLESKGFASPVLRVTPIQVKSKKSVDTKIRVAMKKSVPYEFRQEGDMIYIDFKNPEGVASEPVALPAKMAAKAAKPKTVTDEEIGTVLDNNQDTIIKTSLGSKTYKGRKVTLEFADAEVRKIFQLLSEVSNKNFVLGDDVTGNISIKLVNVPWDQALDIILDTKGLDKREEGNIIIIKGKGKFKSQAEEDLEIKKQKYKAIELKTEAFSINYADLPSVVTQFNSLKTERGTITPDARTNKVFVKDIPMVLDDIRKLLAQIDIPEKQVMIEARIVEASSTFTRSLGVNWGVHYRDGSASFLGINKMDTSFGGLTSTAAPSSGLSGLPGGAVGISFGTLTSNVSLDLRLNAAATAGLIKIVSTPKVATLNNKSAKITQGQQIPYTSSTSDKVETKFVEAALSLEVTPHINANGTIGMKIDAKNDSVGQATGGSTAPAINKKQATTEMLLRDGETTVIGGIYVDSDNETDDGVPYLMDIPLLGKLFKSNIKTKVKTELLIFITPRILNTI
jgi:type IV pilus assembly protein PilQ